MEIADLQARQGNVTLTVEVVEKGDVREFQKFGNTGRVCNAVIKDKSGQVQLTLWNDQVDQVNVGDQVTITNGYVNEFQGKLQLTTGKFGQLEVGGGSTPAEAPAAEPAPQEEPDVEEEQI